METFVINELRQYEAIADLKRSNTTKEWSYPAQMKPCIAILLTNGEIGPTNIDDAAFLIIQELGRLGASDAEIIKAVNEWNQKVIERGGTKYLRPSDIHGKIRYLRRHENGDRRPGCNHWMSKMLCVGKDVCMYYQKLLKNNKPLPPAVLRQNNFWKFWYLWRDYLSPNEICLYAALLELEKIRGVGPGGLIIVNREQLSRYSRIHYNSVFKVLDRLQINGLVKYEKGKPNEGTKVSRVVPIPSPKKAKSDPKT